MSEFNADGDVTGPYDQAAMIREFCDMLKNDPEQGWFSGFTFYQFRDRGRLGLEIEDPNNPDVGIEQPALQTYKEIIHDDYFYPAVKQGAEIATIDFMPAFFEKPLDGAADLTLKIFAPPASGENDPSQGEDWQTNYYTTINKLPNIRIRFAPIIEG